MCPPTAADATPGGRRERRGNGQGEQMAIYLRKGLGSARQIDKSRGKERPASSAQKHIRERKWEFKGKKRLGARRSVLCNSKDMRCFALRLAGNVSRLSIIWITCQFVLIMLCAFIIT